MCFAELLLGEINRGDVDIGKPPAKDFGLCAHSAAHFEKMILELEIDTLINIGLHEASLIEEAVLLFFTEAMNVLPFFFHESAHFSMVIRLAPISGGVR